MKSFSAIVIFVLMTVSQYAQGGNVTTVTLVPINAVIHHPGDTAYLGCVPSQSNKDITWYRNEVKLGPDDRHTVIEYPENSTLEIKYVGRDDIGTYTCKEEDTQIEGIVHLKSAPFVYNTKSINLNSGNTLNLECRGFGIPAPEVKWFKGDAPVVEDGKRIHFKNTTYMQNGELVIENLEISDYSNYMCMAINEYGTYNSTTLVRVKSSLRVLWPISGIIIQLTILAIIIIVYERRKRSKQAKAE